MALTCRAWLVVCAPQLYEDIKVRSTQINEFVNAVSTPGSLVAQWARRLRVLGQVPWQALPRLLSILPVLTELRLTEGCQSTLTSSLPYIHHHPALLRICSVQSIASQAAKTASITFLDLVNQQFASTVDVLRLLCSFRRLESARFDFCTIRGRSAATPFVRATHLHSIRIRGEVFSHGVWSLLLWSQWRQFAADCEMIPYPGLHAVDAQNIVTALASLTFDEPSYQL